VTTDPKIAAKYGMHDETEFWDDEEPEEQSESPDAPSI
jgi:hypothetical protein